jgi:hypothetical protein
MEGAVVIIQLGLRVVGIIVCANKAKELNRSTGGWGFFGFVSPIIAMIWIHCMKPVTDWNQNIDIK